LKVLLVSSNSGSRGGGEIYLHYLADGLSQLGCEVHALVGTDASMDELAVGLSEVSTVHRLHLTNTYRRSMRSLGAVVDADQRRRVRLYIERLAPDVVHINQQVAEDGLDLLLAAGDARHTFITTIHITDSSASLGAKMGALRDFVAERVISRLAPPLIVVSAASGAKLRVRRRLSAANITVIHPAVPPADPEVYADARARARCDWDLNNNEVAIGAAGRIEDQKNPLFLVDLLAHLVASGCSARLVWIGDGALRPALETRALEHGVADRLIIDGWRDDARLRMAGFDVLAMPSRFEGLPLALLEAMHAGLAVCVSDADGMPEAVTDGRDGLILPVSAPEAWREAIGGLVENATVRGRLGAAARDTARTRFSLEAMARATRAVYEQTIAETARCQRDALAG
jgi:glycosyltransferase involved in cell wall biosynthesis